MPASISKDKFPLIKKLYANGYSMNDIAKKFNVSLDSVVYFMRKNRIKRRNLKEAAVFSFENKPASFKKKEKFNKELEVAGVMLYWAEGYKTKKASGIDFANSDPEMIGVFVNFLRGVYDLDESRFRVLLYCYSNQNIPELIKFWSRLISIPKKQFIKPYVRKDFRKDGRRMKRGLVHIRYSDKKMLLDFKNLLQSYKQKFA